MTFAVGHVQGGTGAGKKRAPAAPAKEWPCICAAEPSVTITGGTITITGATLRFPMRVRDESNVVVTIERKVNPGYLNRCPDCDERRPGSGRPGRR